MAARGAGIICPKCGTTMNHHAEKLVEPSTPEEMAQMDPALGGVLEELHSCPNCGFGLSRRAS